MVVTVEVRHIRRISGGPRDLERVEVVGAMSFVCRQATWPAGSMGLRTVSEILFQSKTQTRGIAGSVSSPGILGNTIRITPIILGTTGTRLASIAVLGSHAPTGTILAAFKAVGN